MTSAVREMLDAHPGEVPGLDVGLVAACLEACAECAQRAEMHDHCRICADACRRCEQACRELLDSMA